MPKLYPHDTPQVDAEFVNVYREIRGAGGGDVNVFNPVVPPPEVDPIFGTVFLNHRINFQFTNSDNDFRLFTWQIATFRGGYILHDVDLYPIIKTAFAPGTSRFRMFTAGRWQDSFSAVTSTQPLAIAAWEWGDDRATVADALGNSARGKPYRMIGENVVTLDFSYRQSPFVGSTFVYQAMLSMMFLPTDDLGFGSVEQLPR